MFATKAAVRTFTRNVSTSSRWLGASPINNAFQVLSSAAGSWDHHKHQTTTSSSFSSLQPIRTFSTVPIGSRTLKQLDAATVAKIEEEILAVDTNHDRQLDADELMNLLKKHSDTFSDDEVVEFRELFYAGKAGGTLSFEEFISILDKIAADNPTSHPILDGNCSAEYIYRKSHAKYTPEELDIEVTHRPPENLLDYAAYSAVKVVRLLFDTATGWNTSSTITKEKVINRVIFLETIAAVPGFIAAIVRHFKSLRNMERDGGLLQLFLEEANNERMHLLSFIKLKDPGLLFRGAVIFSQAGFATAFLATYIISPKLCHRFVGYVEEEACATYTKIVGAIEKSQEGDDLYSWKTDLAPNIALGYWELGEKGSVLDLMYAVRADEAEHRDVNHAAVGLKLGQPNPYNDPNTKVMMMLRKYVKDVMSREDKLTK